MEESRLASIIFDKGRRLTESEYKEITSGIDSDAFTLNEYVIDYKAKDSIGGDLFFTLKDDSRVLINKEVLSSLTGLKIDKTSLLEYMSQSKENFKAALKEVIDGE